MKREKGTRGAISVFLAMILVPCIVVSSLFVDLSRVHMSKAMTESSADLALNTLLTNYDADLSDWYGMVASCQNIDEFYTVSAQYFLRTISSQNLSEDEIFLLSDYYSYVTGNDVIYDLLQTECQTDVTTMISAVKNANLAQSSLLKDQIVEFMKYRAPIQIAEDMFSMIKDADGNTTGEASALLESDQNEELVEKKQAFYEAEGDLMKAAYYSYWAIRSYYDSASKLKYDNAKLVEYANKINGYKTDYAMIHNAAVKYLLNTSSLNVYKRTTASLTKHTAKYNETNSSIYSSKKKVDDEWVYYINGDRVDNLLKNLETSIGKFDATKKEFENSVSSLMANLPGTGDNQANPVQWWLQMQKTIGSVEDKNTPAGKLSTAANDMLDAYARVLAIKKCTYDGKLPSGWETRFNTLTAQVASRQSTYLTSGVKNDKDAYLKAVSKLEEVSKANSSMINPATLKVTVDGKSRTVTSAIKHVATELTNLRKELQDRVNELNVAIDGDKLTVKSLDQLASLAKTYESSFNTWEKEADEADTGMKKQDQLAIDGKLTGDAAKANVEKAAKEINEAAITKLKTRLVNIRSQLQSLIDAIDSMKYGNYRVRTITSVGTFTGQTDNQAKPGNIPLKNKDIDKYAGDTFGKLFKPTTSKVITLQNTSSNSYNPNIDPSENNKVDTPALFVHMHTRFKDTKKDNKDVVKSAEDDEAGAEQAQTEYVDKQKEAVSAYRGGGGNITASYSDGNAYSAAKGLLNTTVGLFKDVINGNLDKIRDDVYVTCYITNMFSYATFDYEEMYKLLDDADQKNLTPSTAKSTYDSKVLGAADKKGTWLSTDPVDHYNKTLTNKMINKENNEAYLAEIEYILYGQSTNKANIKKAYGQIYTFRFALNTISAFQHFWTPTANTTAAAVESVSVAISAAFAGVVPAPVVKAVLLPLLAAVESCVDNERLSKGMPVELYKIEADDWWVSVPEGTKGFKAFFESLTEGDIGAGKNQDEGIYYSDYLTFFVYSGLSGGGEVEDDMYERLAEVIQANMRKVIGNGSNFSMKKAQLYFKLEATIQVKPLMITMPIFNDYDNNLSTTTEWCTYTVSTVRGYN